MLGVMGYLNVTLDIATATVAAIVLGIAIDDTIHLLVQFNRDRDKALKIAIMDSFTHVGCAIIVTSIVLILGFLVLVFASVKTVFYFGLLTAIAVLAALIGDLILLPILLKFSFKE